MMRTARGRLRAPFILVTGGKGGVGKTTVCANLGVQLAREGRRVLLVDLDLGLANLGLFLGVSSGVTIEDALAGRVALSACIQEGPGGVHLLPAATGSEELGRLDETGRSRLLELLIEVSGNYDLIVGDSAAGVGPNVLSFAALADRVLVITTPDVAALTDAFGLIKALDHYGRRAEADIPTPEVVVNLSSGVEEGQAIARKLRGVCERFLARSPRQAGWIPRSQRVASSGSQRDPFAMSAARGLEHLCLEQISGRLNRLCKPVATAG